MDKSGYGKVRLVEKQPVVNTSKVSDRGDGTSRTELIGGWKLYDPNAWREEWAANKKKRP